MTQGEEISSELLNLNKNWVAGSLFIIKETHGMCSIINQNLIEIRNLSQVPALIRHSLNQGVADPDPSFHFDAELEPDLASHLQTLYGSFLSLQHSIVG